MNECEAGKINTYTPSTTLTVEYVGYNDSAKVINALTQLLDQADLTHNQQRSVAEWVWMEYGRGGDQ